MRTSLVILVALVLVPALAHAEKVDLTPDQLRETATHVITGEVKAVYSHTVREGSWRVTRYLAEVAVGTVEKGDGLQAGGLAYVRYWHRSWSGPGYPPPSTNGHRGLPAVGQTVRIYLARNAYDGFGTTDDGGLNVIGANGFEALPDGE
jgi:hypothetical protein